MNEDILKVIKNRLKSECYLMNEQWLRDCVNFYFTQHENPSTESILQFAKVQFQLSDLREISSDNGSLPGNLSQQKMCTLPCNYILQVQQMYDISTSKYKQLEQIRNIHMSEVELSETEKLEKWEPPKKRMIQLRLTDGLQEIIGIEYKPMPQLNRTLLPGYKVMIMGPIMCRKGVLLLEEKKFKGIGGEVDSLLIPNALENVLARTLKLPENPDPYNDNQMNTKNVTEKEEHVEDDPFGEDFDIDLDTFVEIENLNNKNNQPDESKKGEAIMAENSSVNSSKNTKIQQMDNNIEIRDEDDIYFTMIDENQLIEPKFEQRNTAAPYRTLPNEEDDDIIIINEEDTIAGVKYESYRKEEERVTPSKSKTSNSKLNSSILSYFQKKEENEQRLVTSTKRSISVSPPEKASLKKGKIETEDIQLPSTSISNEERKICEFIRDINRESITGTAFRTIRGRVQILGKLAKNNSLWSLEARLDDGSGTIEVTFSNKVLEDLLGFSVQEFSVKKKLKKNPEIEQQLRMSFRIAEQKIKTMDALLELQMNANEKPIVINITDLTEEQKQLFDKQLKTIL